MVGATHVPILPQTPIRDLTLYFKKQEDYRSVLLKNVVWSYDRNIMSISVFSWKNENRNLTRTEFQGTPTVVATEVLYSNED